MTISVLPEQEVETISNEITKAKKDIKDNHKLNAESRQTARDIREKIKELESELSDSKKIEQTSHLNMNNSHKIIQRLERLVLEKEEQLAKDAKDKEILSLYERQKPFWEALELRMIQKRQELTLGLVGMKEPTPTPEVINTLREIGDNLRYNGEPRITILNFMNRYKDTLLDMCRLQIEGNPVPADTSQRRINLLDNFLMQEHIQRYWN
tara:strand:- start:211 stop:840 length:630 start_codon:yes stop_codon:yes gene_type:complete